MLKILFPTVLILASVAGDRPGTVYIPPGIGPITPIVPGYGAPTTKINAINDTLTKSTITGSMIAGGINDGGVPRQALVEPCDIAAAALTPCGTAQSVTRRMLASYNGPIFQIMRSNDKAELDIGTNRFGSVNTYPAIRFCVSTTCYISILYDQTGNGNNLPAAIGKMVVFQTSPFNNLPIVQNLQATFGQPSTAYYRKRAATKRIPVGGSAITEYYVRAATVLARSDGDWGDTENTVHDDGAGAMFSLDYGDYSDTTTTGYGHYYGLDLENGVTNAVGSMNGETGSGTSPLINPPLFDLLGKYSPITGMLTLKEADATQGLFATIMNKAPPQTPKMEGGSSLSEGGDGTLAYTAIQEAVVIPAATTDATDAAIQANVAKFYGTHTLQPTAASGGAYRGPGDIQLGAQAWYGLRAFTGAYAIAHSPAIIISRASDNTTATIDVTQAGDLDAAAAGAFCASTACYIRTWIDQTGAGQDEKQLIAADQAQLLFNCNDGSKVCAFFNGNSDFYAGKLATVIPQPFTMNAVYQKNDWTVVTGGAILSTYTSPSGASIAEGNAYETSQGYAGTTRRPFTPSYVFNSFTIIFGGARSVFYENGLTAMTNFGTNANTTSLDIGSNPGPAQHLVGYLDETGLWPVKWSATVAAAEQINQRLYWGF